MPKNNNPGTVEYPDLKATIAIPAVIQLDPVMQVEANHNGYPWVGTAIEVYYIAHIRTDNQVMNVTRVDVPDCVRLRQYPKGARYGGVMSTNPVYFTGWDRREDTETWLDGETIDMLRNVAERHRPKVTGSMLVEGLEGTR